MYFHCYYCSFETDIDRTYQDHVKQSHPDKPVYPNKKQIKELGLVEQNKMWEDFTFEV